jgi:hypothetical protein
VGRAGRHGTERRPDPPDHREHLDQPDGRFFAHPEGNRVELIPLQPDEEELAYRRLHTQPNLGRYRDGYEAAQAANDDFAAWFYLNLIVDRKLAAGRTPDAVVQLARLSAASPQEAELFLTVAALQAWFGQEKEFAATRGCILAFVKGPAHADTAERAARACSILASADRAELGAALALAGTSVTFGKSARSLLALGMAEYRSGHYAASDKALFAAAEAGKNPAWLQETAAFYRAMSLFRLGKRAEARKLALAAVAKMKPLPADEQNPLAGNANREDLILWLAYREAKPLIGFDAPPPPGAEKDKK